MSRYFSEKYGALTPYTPGEQPKDRRFVKLNTNESPFPPAPAAIIYAQKAAEKLRLYSDPDCTALVNKLADCYGISSREIIFTNGSDEVLNFAFMAFCDAQHPAVFADVTYGFYPVFAQVNGVPYETIPLSEDFTVRVEDYLGLNRTIFIANPNAPTGIALPLCDIERILSANPDSVVVVDEAYVDFGAESAVSLIRRYENLLVTQTFSKSRSLAGGRLGMAIGCESLIRDLNTIKYSTNPYNVNAVTQAAGLGALEDSAYFSDNCAAIIKNRAYLTAELRELGFTVTDSSANFVFVKHEMIDGGALYQKLRERGVLVRHFTAERIKDYNRITIGSREQLDVLLEKIREIMEENA